MIEWVIENYELLLKIIGWTIAGGIIGIGAKIIKGN